MSTARCSGYRSAHNAILERLRTAHVLWGLLPHQSKSLQRGFGAVVETGEAHRGVGLTINRFGRGTRSYDAK
jgi:hypothetical protein